MVRKYKSRYDARHHVQMEKGTELLQSLLATAPKDSSRGQGTSRSGALEKGLFSIQVGWVAVVTKLGEGG